MRGSREERILIPVLGKLKSILASTLKEYFSPQNLKIIFFMILSIIPATICHAFYISSKILDVGGLREILFFRIDYTYIDPGYDFIIMPLSILVTLNFGLILMKLIGKILKDKKLIPDLKKMLMKQPVKTLNGKKLILGFEKLVYIALACLVIVVFYSYKSLLTSPYESLLTLLFILIVVFLYSLRKTFSKIIIFPLLLLFNISFFILSYQPFLPGETISTGVSHFLFLLARIGVSSLYILPYNFFFFFPLIIGIYFYDFRYPEKYLSSFFDAVFHENMVAIFVGLLLCMIFSFTSLFIVIAQLPPDFVPYPLPTDAFGRIIIYLKNLLSGVIRVDLEILRILAVFHLWMGSFILWFTPFVVSLTQLETKFEANFDRRLREIIQKMRDHIVIIGFGNLGRKVCSDLIERNVISPQKDTTEVLTPDLEVRKICKNLLVIDVNDELFDRVHTDPILQNIGVARRRPRVAGKKEDILIPAIIGDINSETTKDSSQMRRSKLFISAPSDYRATFTLSKYANARDLNSIISVEDSAQRDYFSPKMTAHDTFFIYPAFQEGIALGRVTSLCYSRLREEMSEEKSKNLEIVIVGEGKQIHYLMETFWMEMERAGIAESWIEGEGDQKTYNPPISILTDSEEIGRRSRSKGEEYEDMRELREIIKRSACKNVEDAYLSVDLILETPDRLRTIERIIVEKEPQIIVVTSNTIQKVSKIFHEWVVGVERYVSSKNRDYKPVIIVGVLGDEYEEIQDILLYYTKMDPESGNKFPVQYLDAAVRAYDDSMEQIGGLAQSFTRKDDFLRHEKRKIGKIKDPLALYCCIEDVPRSLGNLLGNLAGIEFERFNSTNTKHLVSLHFCRFQSCSGVENYSFLANAGLHKKSEMDEEGRLLFCLYQSESEHPEKARESLTGLLDIKNMNSNLSQLDNICDRCCRRITCSVASYFRKVENLNKNREYYEHLETIGKLSPGTVEWELNRFFVNKNFQCINTERKQEDKDLPKAAILVCCRHSQVAGSFSAAVNNLLFRKIKEISDDKPVANITYLRSYECYNPALTNIELYGNWIDICDGERNLLKRKRSIDSVFISVATKRDEWFNYAKRLREVFNGSYGDKKSENEKYKLWADHNRDNIAVIRNGFIEKDNSDKPRPRCEKQGCMIHNKVRLLKEVV
ncbi:MAG: hypothetical protein AYK19_00895 [Theionarchaea archaeon DG-70-1]|nr:MAG: hypothetical protein AYK19_00895 [Theionarchaea archaeon DG-70-1]